MRGRLSGIAVIGALVVLAASSAGGGPAGADPGPTEALARITPGAIRAHMTFLADDLLEGRFTGSQGYRIAAAYVASRFQACGLVPAGESGTYFQAVPLRRADLEDPACSARLTTHDGVVELAAPADILFNKHPVLEDASAEGALVYAGYGVTAPEFDHDDYAGVDVRGKILVLLRGAPARFPHDERAYYSDTDVKYRNAVARGAIGALFLRLPDPANPPRWEKAVALSRIPTVRWLSPGGEVVDGFPGMRVGATLSEEGAAKVFADAPHSLKEIFDAARESRPLSFELPVSAAIRVRTRHQELQCVNVAGMLPGSDPALRSEVVVYTAHLDHLGTDPSREGDGIYNGAYDNASGVAVMLEVAEALASLPRAPRRSILFLAVTGEERGMLGSEYFAEFPTVPLERIVADVNLDMFLMLHPCRDIIAFGAEHSSLAADVEEAAARMGVRVTPDPMPEESIFIRSDQYSFVKKGIPSVFVVSGQDAGDGGEGGREEEKAWDRDFYHTPADDMTQAMDFEAGAVFARINLLLGFGIADAAERPSWKPGDFFGTRFGNGAQ